MKKEPQIFTQIDAQNVPVKNSILDALEQEVIDESIFREYVSTLLAEVLTIDASPPVSTRRPTVGSVLDALLAMKDIKDKQQRRERMEEIGKKIGWEMVKFIPLIGDAIKNAKTLGDIYKLAKDTPDEEVEKDNIVFDMLDIDDKYQEMLDDRLEDLFDSEVIPWLESLPRDAVLPDMNAKLEQWVDQNFDERGIYGAYE
jgi:hypothetical protein